VPALTRDSAPETFGIAPQGVGPVERRNLAIIANLISHVAAQEMANTVKDWFVRTPLQEYIRSDGALFRDFVLDGEYSFDLAVPADKFAVASVDPLETYFQAHELFESTLEATPITITRTEIYGMLSILMKQIPVLVGQAANWGQLLTVCSQTAGKNNDPIGIVLAELEGPPVDYDRSRATFSLRLTNRLAELQGLSRAMVIPPAKGISMYRERARGNAEGGLGASQAPCPRCVTRSEWPDSLRCSCRSTRRRARTAMA